MPESGIECATGRGILIKGTRTSGQSFWEHNRRWGLILTTARQICVED
jgi:hypothetical protein